jgi:hypothetical protein
MNRTRKLAVTAALLVGFTMTACGNDPPPVPVTYAPAAYGENGHCYYDDDIYEAQQLLLDGSCPAGWVAYPMPLYWHEQYADFYASPIYVNRYVVASHRTVYVTHEMTFHATYATQINAASKTATYKGSNGKTVTGPKAGAVTFGGGAGRQQQFGGGSGRTGTIGGATGAPVLAPSTAPKPQPTLGAGNGRASALAPKVIPPKVVSR